MFSVGIRLQMELKCGCSVCAHTATAKAGGKMYYGANGAMVSHFIGTTQGRALLMSSLSRLASVVLESVLVPPGKCAIPRTELVSL